MNVLKLLPLLAILGLASCSISMRTASTIESDDVYYSSNDWRTEQELLAQQQEESNVKEEYVDEQEYRDADEDFYDPTYASDNFVNGMNDGNSDVYINSYYGDFAYASRLRRFNNPGFGWSYYDDIYTNLFWYNYDPFYMERNIYSGYDYWWRPRVNLNIGFGNPWGWGYNNWRPFYVYNPWAYNSWGGNNPYPWRWNSFHHSGYYANSFDGNSQSYSYGHRGNTMSGNSISSSTYNNYPSFGRGSVSLNNNTNGYSIIEKEPNRVTTPKPTIQQQATEKLPSQHTMATKPQKQPSSTSVSTTQPVENQPSRATTEKPVRANQTASKPQESSSTATRKPSSSSYSGSSSKNNSYRKPSNSSPSESSRSNSYRKPSNFSRNSGSYRKPSRSNSSSSSRNNNNYRKPSSNSHSGSSRRNYSKPSRSNTTTSKRR